MSNKNLIIKVVVGIISNSDNELLITKRKKDQFMPGYWELPGGKIESEEDNISALKREFFELIIHFCDKKSSLAKLKFVTDSRKKI